MAFLFFAPFPSPALFFCFLTGCLVSASLGPRLLFPLPAPSPCACASPCRIGDDAIGWCIEILDIPGELVHHLLPDPPPNDAALAAADSAVSPSDTKVWHRVAVIGRPGVSSSCDGVREERRDGGKQDSNGGGAAGTETGTSSSSSSSVFVVGFESGRTASLDLSQFSIKWKHFCGGDGVVGTEEIRGGGEERQQQARTPPGFAARDGGRGSGGGLAYNDTDTGTRVDVWWPRCNSYFRATVRGCFVGVLS